ncbi:MAG TPA: hypothetical protein VHT31_03315 [Candidatus Acidoferrum sp.]|nr:hypothetical protein [Candidatus Acidoferrum sp.]
MVAVPGSIALGLIAGFVAGGFGFGGIGGVEGGVRGFEATARRTWAANSARVVGCGLAATEVIVR